MDTRTTNLAHEVVTNPPAWVDALGPQPADPDTKQAWLERAGVIAGYRETFAITALEDPIGPPPSPDRVDARAWWTRAAAALSDHPTRALAVAPTEHLKAIIERAHTHLSDAPPPVADQLRQAAIALRDARTRQGTAIARGEPVTARRASHAHDLARRLGQLEHAQNLRDRWNLTAGRLEIQASAAQAILDHRQADRHAGPHRHDDTSALLQRLRSARHRADLAADTAERYDHHAQQTDAQVADLLTEIDPTATIGPAQREANQTITAERLAAARIAQIRTALDTTRLRRHTVRGEHRARLQAELHQLRLQHPALGAGDPTIRWDTLITDARDADRHTLAELRARPQQATIDRDWYTNTATQLRADADQQRQTLTSIRTELARRTGTPWADRKEEHPIPDKAAPFRSPHVAHQQLTASPRSPADGIEPPTA